MLIGSARFEVLLRLGQGGMGAVYAAYDRERGTRVALKTLTTMTAERLLLFKKEFRALADLQHENLVHLGELFEEQGQWFFTMELIEGLDFLRYVRTNKDKAQSGSADFDELDDRTTDLDGLPVAAAPARLIAALAGSYDEPRLRTALLGLSHGLVALHDERKVHRDIKPSNILVTASGRVVILDFGIISDLGQREELGEPRAMGTISYMAPEQMVGARVGPAADWYSVGALLYLALSGRLPFPGSQEEVIAVKQRREPPPIHTLVPSVPLDLSELCRDLLRLDPAARPSGAEVLARLLPRGAQPIHVDSATASDRFIGRKEELRALEQAFTDTQRGQAVTVLLHGESGVGKSALVHHFVERQKQKSNALVLSGRCYERESLPYKALDSIIDRLSIYLRSLDLAEVQPLLPRHLGLLAHIFPVLEPLRAMRPASTTTASLEVPDKVEMRRLAFLALRQLLEALSRRAPLLIIIDDLQWADTDSFVLLGELLRPPEPPPILLLSTVRINTTLTAPRPLPPLPGEVRELHIEKLGTEDARDLVISLLGDSRENQRMATEIADEAQGHPLFIDELVRLRRAQAEQKTESEQPLRLDEALWQRVRRLEVPARNLLAVIAVAGIPIPQETAAQAAAIDSAHFDTLLGTLRTARLVRTSGPRRQDPIEPYHDRVRESVVARLDGSEQRSWHARLAVAHEAAAQPDPEALIRYWTGAGRPERAAEYAMQAAERATKALAFDRAARLYRQAIELLAPTGAAKRELLEKLADALINASRGYEAAEVLVEAAEGAGPAHKSTLRGRAADQFMRSGHVEKGVQLVEQSLRDLGLAFPKSTFGIVSSLLLRRVYVGLRGFDFKERDESLIPPEELQRIDALRSCAVGLGGLDPARGGEFNLRHLILSLRAGEPSRIALGLMNEAMASCAMGTEASCQRGLGLLARARELAQRQGKAYSLAFLAYSEGVSHHCMGLWPRSLELLSEAESLFRERCEGVGWELATVRPHLLSNAYYRGDLRRIIADLPTCVADAEARNDLHYLSFLGALAVPIWHLIHDEPRRARDETLARLRQLRHPWVGIREANTITWVAQSLLYEGNAEDAYRRLRTETPKEARMMQRFAQIMRAIYNELCGRTALAMAQKRPAEKARYLHEAEQMANKLRDEKRAWITPYSHALRAGIAAQRGQAQTTLAELTRADELFDESQMPLFAVACRRRRGQLRGGDAGAAEIKRADEWLRKQGVVSPARFAAMLLPGYSEL